MALSILLLNDVTATSTVPQTLHPGSLKTNVGPLRPRNNSKCVSRPWSSVGCLVKNTVGISCPCRQRCTATHSLETHKLLVHSKGSCSSPRSSSSSSPHQRTKSYRSPGKRQCRQAEARLPLPMPGPLFPQWYRPRWRLWLKSCPQKSLARLCKSAV